MYPRLHWNPEHDADDDPDRPIPFPVDDVDDEGPEPRLWRDPADEAFRHLDELSTTLDSFRAQLDEEFGGDEDDDWPPTAA